MGHWTRFGEVGRRSIDLNADDHRSAMHINSSRAMVRYPSRCIRPLDPPLSAVALT